MWDISYFKRRCTALFCHSAQLSTHTIGCYLSHVYVCVSISCWIDFSEWSLWFYQMEIKQDEKERNRQLKVNGWRKREREKEREEMRAKHKTKAITLYHTFYTRPRCGCIFSLLGGRCCCIGGCYQHGHSLSLFQISRFLSISPPIPLSLCVHFCVLVLFFVSLPRINRLLNSTTTLYKAHNAFVYKLCDNLLLHDYIISGSFK